MALKQPTSNKALVAMELKANRKYKTKKEKEKKLTFKELAAISKAMVEGHLFKGEA
jgi:hypothetical protein